MITQKKIANAVGGKTARACESCLKRRAKWFCAADDAFLCHACDSSVHSANELAGRHNRVRLEAKTNTQPPPPTALPCTSWHHGFTKKARTPRGNSKASKLSHRINNYEMRVVPEVSNDQDEGSVGGDDEDRNEAVFSVPNLDVHQHLFESKGFEGEHIASAGMDDFNISLIGFDGDNEWENYLPDGFLPSDIELAEFAADVESLLDHPEAGGDGVKADKEAGEEQLYFPGVKIEEGEISTTTTTTTTNDHCYFDWSIDVETEMFNFDLNTDYMGNDQSQVSGAEEEEENGCRQVVMPKNEGAEVEVKEEVGLGNDMEANNSNKRRKILLRLNYDEVINAWTSQGCVSPWTTGHRPEFDLDHHGWPYCMGGTFPYGVHRQGEEWMGVRGGDEVREARVSRYREKRRTRLFSKKIRYEVRKLNAEKRPRLKGRFVKRTSLSSVVAVGVDC